MNEETDEKVSNIAPKLKVCGHSVRLKILCAIEKDESCVTELWTCLDQPQPVVSQHLAVLKRKGIVSSQVKGNKRYYSICDPFIKSLVRTIL